MNLLYIAPKGWQCGPAVEAGDGRLNAAGFDRLAGWQ